MVRSSSRYVGYSGTLPQALYSVISCRTLRLYMLVLDASFSEELLVLDLDVSKSGTAVCGNSHEAITFEQACSGTVCYFGRTSGSVWFLS
jgi:hypothetical protein